MDLPKFEGWLAHGWGLRVRTAQELFEVIGRIALLSPDRTYAWRGQNNASWDLSSSLIREIEARGMEATEARVREREQEILVEARRWGLGRDLGPSATDLHMLAILQHHGVPTRLVDVTANPMTAMWFAAEEQRPDSKGQVGRCDGVVFAIDVTETEWYESFQYVTNTYAQLARPLEGAYELALDKSAAASRMFRVFSALPDERMKAQEGFFIGSAVPEHHEAVGIRGLNPIGPRPAAGLLEMLRSSEASPETLSFCAIVIPADVKDELRGPLKHTYNRRRRVLFPDVDGFREGLVRGQLD
ncbi:FRG domain-containing protein [Lentzea sp. NPDC092896]|uniref:FRG domain-containing protein n=1 Tax=Lentzea sp. NPDC092896 TaxID=3364127 RepID=UPI00380BB9C3